jgi:hypothetical protein
VNSVVRFATPTGFGLKGGSGGGRRGQGVAVIRYFGRQSTRAGRPLQHLELVAEDEDLEVLGAVVSVTLAAADEETDEGAGDEVQERPHQPIVPVVIRARIGVSDPHGI